MSTTFLKATYNYPSKYSSKEINSLSLTHSPINRTFLNLSCYSRLSTKLNSSESLLFKSLYINDNTRKFQIKNLKLKNKIFTSFLNDINNKTHSKFLHSKISNNISILNLPLMENKNGSFTPPPEKIKIFSKSNDNNNISIKTNIKKNQFQKYFSNSVNNIKIKKISPIEMKLRNELLDIQNFKDINLGCNNYNNKYYFKESTKHRILIKKYVYDQGKNYLNNLKNNIINKKNIIEKEKKFKNLFELISHNKLNILNDYHLFLQQKIHELKENDFQLFKEIEYLKRQVKNLFIKIKIKSDRLWLLFDIRNFLICVKEGISMSQLPLVFKFYNPDYLYDLSKLNENDIYILEKMEKPKKSINLFRLPTNLIVYIRTLSGFNKNNIDKRFSKYLDNNYVIFQTPEEFIEKYILTEKDMLEHLRNSLYKNNFNQFEKIKLKKKVDEMEKNSNIFEEFYNRSKKIYNEINNKYIKQSNQLILLKENEKEIKTEENEKIDIKEDEFFENEKKIKNNEIFLKLLQNKNTNEKKQFLLRYKELKNIKKFRTEKEYVYYFIIKNILQLFKIYPEYFYNQDKFSLKKMYKYISNIKYCSKFPDSFIQLNIIYLLNIYESAITDFLLDYRKNLKLYSSTNFYKKIRKDLILNKKIKLLQQQKILENKVKKMKFEKINLKQTRYRYKQRNVVIPNSLSFKKAYSMNSMNNNKNINKQKESNYEEMSLLSF